MFRTPRIGIQIDHDDPFWVQVREVIWQHALAQSLELVEVAILDAHALTADQQTEAVENLAVQGLDALICNTFPQTLLEAMLVGGLPIIYVSECSLRHPRFVSREGLVEAGAMLGRLVAERLTVGEVLLVGGLFQGEDYGHSRLDGFRAGLGPAHRLTLHHLACPWRGDQARPFIAAWLDAHPDLAFAAIFGLSDALALAARELCTERKRLAPETMILGVNGDPLALAALHAGQMTATVETDVDDIAAHAVRLAMAAARGEPLPATFTNRQHLVTPANLADCAVRKLLSLADLPSRLVGLNMHNAQQRMRQLETSLAIDQQVRQILDEQQLALAIIAQIRDSYGFDHARLLLWDPEREQLFPVGASARDAPAPGEPPDPDGPLAYALSRGQPVLIPDTRASNRFPPDTRWPTLRARVVVPVRLGGQVVGLLDLQRARAASASREELTGLQLLADQLAIAMRNARLYGQEQEARAVAEQADRLKTTLLANVSHELRTPLNLILGYSRGALDGIDRATPAELAADLKQIYQSGEHLLRLINDLLDLSRAEIGELDLVLERIDTRSFLEEVFAACKGGFAADSPVAWQLALPPALPAIDADSMRLRQILLNLLHNAHKFTAAGTIILGAEAAGAELAIWVTDTGPGIEPAVHEQLFDPFVSARAGEGRHEGIGLGLNITRRLVALHHGQISVASAPGVGSTFRVVLPIPTGDMAVVDAEARRVLLLISEAGTLPEPIVQLAARRGLDLHLLRANDNLAATLQTLRPALLAWDAASAAEDGWRVVEAIRARPELRQLPVLIYNGAVDAAVDTAGLATGVLLKPLADEVLLEALSDLDPHLPDGNILIVEDEPHVRALHRRLIARHFPGYRVRDVGDGHAALAALAEEPPSLVVLDLMMPEPDGFAVLESMRADPHTAAVPVLVLSGKLLASEDIRRLSTARVIFQTKGVLSTEELAEALRRSMAQDERLPQHTSAMVKQALAFIQQQYAEPLSRQAIADAVGVHKDYLGRIFQQELGLSPWEYLIRYRLLRAKALLRETDLPIADVASRVGFETPTYFSQVFHREEGCSPRAFRVRVRSGA